MLELLPLIFRDNFMETPCAYSTFTTQKLISNTHDSDLEQKQILYCTESVENCNRIDNDMLCIAVLNVIVNCNLGN